MADPNGIEHIPDDMPNAQSGFLVDTKSERGARSARATSRRDPAAAAQDRLAFLSEASRSLAASLDYESTLTNIAGMSASYFDAWVILDVVNDDGEIRRISVQHPDPEKQDAARALEDGLTVAIG